MSIIQKNGMAFGTHAVYLMPGVSEKNTDGKDSTIAPAVPELGGAPWSKWGNNNLLPLEIMDHLENCSVLTSGIDTKARIAIAKGLRPFKLMNVDPATGEEQLEFANDPEILDFLEMNDDYNYALGITKDGLAFGWDHTQIILNKGRSKINRLLRTDVSSVRLAKADSSGIIRNSYLCSDWKQYNSSYNPDYHKKISLLQPGMELQDLTNRSSGYEFGIINRYITNNKFYYPLPMWWAARMWVEIAKEIPLYKKSAFKNQMSLKYVVSISDSYWNNNVPGYANMSPQDQKKAREDLLNEVDNYLTGSENAHKSIIASTTVDRATGKEVKDINIDVLDDKMKDGKMLPDSAAADKQIMFALQMNPALNGSNLLSDGASGGGGSGSDIREAFLVQVMLNEFERRKAARVFNIIKRFNGWSDRYDKKGTPLIFRYPSSVLTTLDTGKSTKPANT